MAEYKLTAEVRDATGKGPARRARSAGRVPAVLYGGGIEPRPISVDRRQLLTAFHTDAGLNVLLDIDLDGETILALTKELQRDPVKGALLHADFVKVDRSQEVEVEVPVHLAGEAPGVKVGGVLEQPLFSVHVRCKVSDVPEQIEADISAMSIGDSLRVNDLAEGRDFHILNDPETVVVSIAAPITQEQFEAMEAEAGIEVPAEEAAEAAEEAPSAAEEAAEGAPEQAE